MSGIRGKDTKPEVLIRKALHSRGFRYRLHASDLPGKPDLVFPRYGAALFVHGCFWHGHDCKFFKLPSTRPDFWAQKISANRERDRRQLTALKDKGWRTLVVWECAIRKNSTIAFDVLIECIVRWLINGENSACIDLAGIESRQTSEKS